MKVVVKMSLDEEPTPAVREGARRAARALTGNARTIRTKIGRSEGEEQLLVVTFRIRKAPQYAVVDDVFAAFQEAFPELGAGRLSVSFPR